ncbi:MAG: hypothetical protein V3V19_05690 [Cocleimonas sp.]
MNFFKVAGMGSLVLLPFFLSVTTEAQIFKCSNENGEVYYNDKPCPIEDEEKKIRNEKDVLNGYVPNNSLLKGGDQKKSSQQTKQTKQLANSAPKKVKKIVRNRGNPPGSGGRRGEGSARKSYVKETKKAVAPPAMNPRTNQKLTLKDKKRMLGIYQTVE